MKTIILSAIFTACCGLFSNNGFAQNGQPQTQKNEEIIIRKNGNAPDKMMIEIDSNNITVNGKPLSDYNGDVTIMKRNFMGGEGNQDFNFHNGNFNRFDNSGKAFLGVLTAKTDKGAAIKEVVDESAAKKAGLQEGDIITKVGDKAIVSPEDLRNAIQDMKPGDKTPVTYIRNGKAYTKTIELGSNENNTINLNSENMQGMMKNIMPFKNYNFGMQQIPRPFNFFNENNPKMGLQIENTENNNGVKILDVIQGSAAAKAGLKKDDIITEINGEKVNDVNDVMSQINQSANKNEYKIKAKRDKNEMNFEVKIPKVLKKINV